MLTYFHDFEPFSKLIWWLKTRIMQSFDHMDVQFVHVTCHMQSDICSVPCYLRTNSGTFACIRTFRRLGKVAP